MLKRMVILQSITMIATPSVARQEGFEGQLASKMVKMEKGKYQEEFFYTVIRKMNSKGFL